MKSDHRLCPPLVHLGVEDCDQIDARGDEVGEAGRPISPAIRRAIGEMVERLDELVEATLGMLREQEPAYADVVSEDELRQLIRANSAALLGSASRGEAIDYSASRRMAKVLAERGVPLAVVLRGARLGGEDLWRRLSEYVGDDGEGRKELLAFASQLWELNDEIGILYARVYEDVESQQTLGNAQHRAEAIASLLSGAVPVGQNATDVVTRLNLPREGLFVAVASDLAADPTPDIQGLEDALSVVGVRSVWHSGADEDAGVVVLTKRNQLEDLASRLISLRPGCRIGVSETYTSIAGSPQALAHARLARDAASSDMNPFVRYEQSLLAAILASQPEMSRGLSEDVLGRVLSLPDRDRVLLLQTLRAWFVCQGSAQIAAQQLSCHPNTVRYRMAKLASLTVRDLESPVDVAHLYVAAEAYRLHPR